MTTNPLLHLVDEQSPIGYKSELDWFQVSPTTIAVQESRIDTIQLQNPVTDTGPWIFRVPPDPGCLDMAANNLVIRMKIVKEDGTNLAADDKVGTINCIAKTFIRNVKLFIGNRLVSDSNQLYAYRSFIETELNYGPESKASHLLTSGYCEDRPYDKINGADNTGLAERIRWFALSNVVEFWTPIHCDLFHQPKYLPGHVEMALEINRNSDSYILHCPAAATNNYKIHIESMEWKLKRVQLAGSIALALEQSLAMRPAKFNIRRVHLSSIHINAGVKSTPAHSVLTGTIPRRLLVGLVDTNAFHGEYTTSPLVFRHYSLIECSVIAAGRSYPVTPMRLDFESAKDKRYLEAYNNLMEMLDYSRTDRTNGLTPDKWSTSCSLFAFDLTSDRGKDSGAFEVIKEGTVQLKFTFSKPIPNTNGGVEAIIYAEHDSIIQIDRTRTPFCDYSA